MNSVKNNPKRGRPVGSSNPTYILSNNQIRNLYNVCCGKFGLRNRAIISLGLHSGARIGTITGLTCDQLVDKHGKCRPSYIVQANNEKSNRVNRYYISRQGQKFIQDYINSIEIINGKPLFPSSRTGGFMTANSGSRLIARLLKSADIDDNSSHFMRKQFSSTLYTKHSIGIVELSTLLNHTNISNTRKYIQGLQPNIENAMKNLSY
jgi:site-specific recombinase XerD